MNDNPTPMPLFTSGAIVINCEYDIHIAREQHSSEDQEARLRLWCDSTVTGDMLSVQPHDVVWTWRHHGRTNINSPIMSSLNGFRFARRQDNETTGLHHAILEASEAHGASEKYAAYTKLRQEFARYVQVQGIAKGAWEYDKIGLQMKQIAVGVAGTESVKVDHTCHPADTLVADMPWFDVGKLPHPDGMHGHKMRELDVFSPSTPWGLCKSTQKRGKVTMVVRPLPRYEHMDDAALDKHLHHLMSFQANGQILGTCESVNQLGRGNADIVLGTCPRLLCH